MASSGSIQPNTAGPTKTPTINSPITVGRPSGRKVTATSQIPASKMSKSSATLCMSGVSAGGDYFAIDNTRSKKKRMLRRANLHLRLGVVIVHMFVR